MENESAMKDPIVLCVAPDAAMPLRGLSKEDLLGRMPNIGILYLAGALERAGYDAITLDRQYSGLPADEVAAEIESYNPGLVGFTLYDITMETTRQIMSCLRRTYSGPIVVGGYTPTFHAQDILEEWPDVDFVVKREGETAIVDLVRYLEGRTSIEDVPNLTYRSAGAVHSNPEGRLQDVRSLPWPSRNFKDPADVNPIVTRRGCFSRCSFCSMVPFYDTSLGDIVRTRDPADVVDEIESLVARGLTEFMFYDDDFGLSTKSQREWCIHFKEEIQRRGVHFHWSIELRVTDVIRGASLLRELCDVGLAHISLGVESMLPRQLELYNKGYKQRDVYEAIEVARELPIDHQTNVIFWDPWSTMEEFAEHIRLLDSIRIQDQLGSANFSCFFNSVIPRSGTKMNAVIKEAGLLRRSPKHFYEFEYDFVDPEVRAFHESVFQSYLFHIRIHARPEALWLYVPQAEHAGDTELAAQLRSYAKQVSDVDFSYFRELVHTSLAVGDVKAASAELAAIHADYTNRLAECAGLLPADGVAHA